MTKEGPAHDQGPSTIKAQTLAAVIPESWFPDKTDASAWFRLYTCLGLSADQLPEVSRVLGGVGPLVSHRKPVLIQPAEIRDFAQQVLDSARMHCKTDGSLVFPVQVKQLKLPDSVYVIAATPFSWAGECGDGIEARGILDHAVALVSLHTGLNFMRDLVFEAELVIATGGFVPMSPPQLVPRMFEGPFLGKGIADDIREISRELRTQPLEKRSRAEASLEFLHRAMRSDHGFLDYWFAMEILVGTAGAIAQRLRAIYGLASHRDAEIRTGFGVIKQWRHDYVHRGVRVDLQRQIERYLQCMCLDLIRDALKLEPRGYVACAQQGIDLRQLNLADNRSDEEKRAEAEALARLGGAPTRRDRPTW
jgi:hypothetical protein